MRLTARGCHDTQIDSGTCHHTAGRENDRAGAIPSITEEVGIDQFQDLLEPPRACEFDLALDHGKRPILPMTDQPPQRTQCRRYSAPPPVAFQPVDARVLGPLTDEDGIEATATEVPEPLKEQGQPHGIARHVLQDITGKRRFHCSNESGLVEHLIEDRLDDRWAVPE